MRKVGIVVFVLLFISLALLPVWGGELDELRKQQEQAAEQIKKHQQEIAAKNKEIKTIGEQMNSLDRSIEAVERDLRNLETELAEIAERIEQVLEELAEAKERLQERTEVFKNRVVGIYHNGDVSFLEVLMDSASMTDFLVRMELLQKIAEHDMKLLEQIEAEKLIIETKRAQLEADRNRINQVKLETESKKERLAKQQEEKLALAEALKNDKDTIEKALAEEEETSKKLAAKIREIQARLGSDREFSGGKMAWPTPGITRITSEYGPRYHPVLKQNRVHTGIDIGAPAGTEILAADYGEVIYVGYFGAYGNSVIIDHGSGITTLYAHMSSFSTKEGVEILRGEPIGKVGSTGLSTGPHLHFEVRKNGEHINPWPYLR